MDRSRITALLDKNADMWPIPSSTGQMTFQACFIVTALILYTLTLTIVLLCATGGGSLVVDRIATDPAFSDDAWIILVINFSFILIYTTWIAFFTLICISYPLAVETHIRRRSQKNEV